MRVSLLEVREGYRYPWWLGFAWMELDTRNQIVFPIPFNWILRWGRNVYYAIKFPKPHDIENAISMAYSQGIKDVSNKRLDAYEKGIDDANNAFLKHIDERFGPEERK